MLNFFLCNKQLCHFISNILFVDQNEIEDSLFILTAKARFNMKRYQIFHMFYFFHSKWSSGIQEVSWLPPFNLNSQRWLNLIDGIHFEIQFRRFISFFFSFFVIDVIFHRLFPLLPSWCVYTCEKALFHSFISWMVLFKKISYRYWLYMIFYSITILWVFIWFMHIQIIDYNF